MTGTRRIVLALIVALSISAAINAYWFAPQFPDEVEYWTLAENLTKSGMLSLDGATPSAYRPPLVAWILAPITATGASLSVARIFFVLFFCASGILSAAILRHVFPKKNNLIVVGVAFVLCDPLYFFSAGNLYPQQVLTPLFLTCLVAACWRPITRADDLFRTGLIGVCTVASLLASAPSMFSLLPFWFLLGLDDLRSMREANWRSASRLAIAVAVVIVCLSPYLYRNFRFVHSGIYLSLNSGINLLLGNSPKTTPSSGVDVDLEGIRERLPEENEFDANKRLTQIALQNIKKDPAHYARLYVGKFISGFGSRVATVTHGYNRFGTWLVRLYMICVWAGVAVLLVLRFREGLLSNYIEKAIVDRLICLVLASYLLNLAGYALFFNRLRFRIPLDVGLALLSSVGWLPYFLISRYKLRRQS